MRTCECGCGTVIKSVSDYGRPVRFVSGHNGRGQRRPDRVVDAIRAAKIGDRNPMFGKLPHNYAGRAHHADGYILIHSPDHPYADKGHHQVMEHRLVVESHLRENDPASPYLVEIDGELYLRREIEVHHIDGVKDNNAVENLLPMTKADHAAHHLAERSKG